MNSAIIKIIFKKNSRIKLVIILFFTLFGLNAQTSIEKLKQALTVSSINQKPDLLFKLSDYYKKNNKPDSVIIFANLGLSIINQQDVNSQYKFCLLLSDAYEKQENTLKVVFYLTKMIKIAEDKKDKKNLADLYLKIGMKYGRLSLFDNALYNFHNSLEVYKQINDSIGISNSYKNLGTVYNVLNEIPIAITNFKKSIDISVKINDKKGLAYALRGIGSVYSIALNNKTEAIKYYLRALRLLEEINDIMGVAKSLSDIADIYSKQKSYKNAFEYYKKSLALNINDQRYTSLLYHRIGRTYYDLKDYDNALKYFQLAENIATKIGDLVINCANYNSLTDWYANNGDFKNAYKYHLLYTNVKDSIQVNQNNNKINQLKIKYDIEGFEKENQILKQKSEIQQLAIQKQTYLRNTFIAVSVLITLLVLFILYRFLLKKKANKVLYEKNQQISIQNKQLEEAYATKDKLFGIITHDLKNPFGALVSLSSFLESNFKKLEDIHKYKGIESLKRSIDEIYNLLINMSDWLNSKENKIILHKTFFDLNTMVNSVYNLYRTTAEEKSIDLQIHMTPDILAYGDERMIKTILRNLIDNATKFTAQNGKIDVNVKEEENQVVVSVTDSGIGISETNKNKIFNLETQFHTLGGLGLIIAKEFTEKNGGEIWFESEAGKGSTFYFTITKGVFYE